MSTERHETVSQQEPLPFEQVTALRGYSDSLFQNAAKPFGGVTGVGSTEQAPPNRRVRYRSSENNTLWTILEPNGTPAPADWILTLEVETPVPSSVRWPNTYLQERFVIKSFNGMDYCNYSLGVTTYTPEGQYIPSVQDLDGIRDNHLELADFGPYCTPEHFLDRLLSVAQLNASDEVGCDPNPYALD